MTTSNSAEQNRSGIVGKALMGTALAGAVAGGMWFQSTQTEAVRGELAKTQQNMAKMRGELDESVTSVRQQAEEQIAKINEKMASGVASAQKASQVQVARNQAALKQHSGKVFEELNARNEKLVSEMDAIKQESANKSTQFDESLSGIKGDVGTVREEVAATKTEVDKSIADLRRIHGDMGVMSGLIATNSTELETLKKLGERDYYEFSLTKASSSAPQKVGGIQLALKKADLKRNRFTIDVIADDRRIEKKDKGLNEPVQFYTSHARVPFEVVVNQISKDKVSGYLSVPKVRLMARN